MPGSAENIGEVFLQEAVLVHEELEDFERLGAGKLAEKNALHRGHREHRGHRAARNDRTRMLARRPGLRAARAKSADAGEGDVVVAGGGRRAGEQRQERFLTFVRNDGWERGLSDERHGSASSSKSGRLRTGYRKTVTPCRA